MMLQSFGHGHERPHEHASVPTIVPALQVTERGIIVGFLDKLLGAMKDGFIGIALVAAVGEAGESYNIGGGLELTNVELTGRLLEAMGADWDKVTRVQDRKGHDLRYSVDHSKLAALGYAPLHSFEDGLAETVAWYRANEQWWRPLKSRAALAR